MIAMSSPRPLPSPRTPVPPATEPPATPPSAAPPLPDAPAPPISRTPVDEDEYTERVTVPSQLALGTIVAVVAAIILIALGLWPMAIVAVVVVGLAAYYLGTQTLTISRTRISIGQGRGDTSPYTIQIADVAAAGIEEVSWPQCFGIGVPDTVDTTRFTVRAGPVLSLTMRDGELIRISAADPAAALARIAR